jgi:hypothetical protein
MTNEATRTAIDRPIVAMERLLGILIACGRTRGVDFLGSPKKPASHNIRRTFDP